MNDLRAIVDEWNTETGIKPEMIDKHDLETIEAYFATCFNCGATLMAHEDWDVAAAQAMDAGYRVIDGDVHCKDCIPLILQRKQEALEDK